MTRRHIVAPAALVVLALTLVASPAVHAQRQYVGVLVAPFAGPDPLARKAATILHLQTWQTLIAAREVNARKLSFRRAIAQWTETTPPRSHAEALALLPGTESQMTLWGQAQPFGKGIVVQAYLSVGESAAAASQALWTVEARELPAGERRISVGLPATLFEFAPIVLREDVIPLLNTPVGMPIYKDRAFKEQIGELAGHFEAKEHAPNAAYVVSNGAEGWVRLPGLSANRTEVTDFAGGLIRIFRQDWAGAIELFERVTRSKTAPVSIRISSYQLMAAASHLLHVQVGTPSRSLEYAEAAEALNPYLRETVKSKCMALLAAGRSAATMDRLAATIRRSAYLFPKGDPWLERVRRVIGP